MTGMLNKWTDEFWRSMIENEKMAMCLVAGVPIEYTYESLPNGDTKMIATTKHPVGFLMVNGQAVVMVKQEIVKEDSDV